ncbi:CRISPR-associated endonuclease/helicase Cas3 [bacterium HR25]|nr:CRISPR-associated endonuclease/helicase Cas3 [bacterium HR25]
MRDSGSLLAKREAVAGEARFQSLLGHSQDTVIALGHLLRGRGVAAFCQRWQIPPRDLETIASAVCLLHDWGKSTKAFQEAIAQGRHSPDFPHALVALPLVTGVWQRLCLPTLWTGGPLLEALAVASHHTGLYSGLYKGLPQPLRRLGYRPETGEQLDAALGWLGQRLGDERLRPLGAWPVSEWGQLTLERCVDVLYGLGEVASRISSSGDDATTVRVKVLYSFLLSLLKQADQRASQHFASEASRLSMPVVEALGPPSFPWQLPDDARERVVGSVPSLYAYQRRLAGTDAPYVVLMAPCGRGKTEAALLWALGLWREGRVDRIVFALPTQVTSNAMHQRLADLFGRDAVGLYHGRSYLEQRELARLGQAGASEGEDIDPAAEMEIARSENYQGEHFLRPVTITTVDHLLYTFVHGYSQADMSLGTLQTAAIVFDEVHYYDRHMLAELRELFHLLRLMQVPHLLMSGTLPAFLVQEARLTDYCQVSDEEGLGRRPFYLRTRQEPLLHRRTDSQGAPWAASPEALDEIVAGHRRGLVQFVVVNTVARAQGLYLALRENLGEGERLVCLHSRFAYQHRRQKERQVLEWLRSGQRPLLLVATQVIEVSLDISCDRMYSELCPVDALAQRAGRLNRGAAEPDGHELVVFPVSSPEPYLERRGEPLPYLTQTWELLSDGLAVSYAWAREACDRLYRDATLGVADLTPLFRRCTLFGPGPDEVRFSDEQGKIYQPRRVTMPTFDVIPQAVLDTLGEEGLDSLYLTPVPLWWLGKSNREGLGLFYPHTRGKRTWYICRLPYDEEVGFHEEAMGQPPEGFVID